MRNIAFDPIQTTLLDCILDNREYSSLLSEIYRQTRLPMIAFDVSFNLIAYAFERPFYIPGWERLAADGTASEELVLSANYLQAEEQILVHKSSLIVETAGKSELKTAFGPVFDHGTLTAYIATVVEDADPDDVIRLNDLVCRTFPLRRNLDMATEAEKLGRDILLENPVSEAQLPVFVELYPGPYQYGYIETGELGKAKKNYIFSRLRNNPGRIAAFDENENIRLLFCNINSEKKKQQIRAECRQTIEKYNCRIGLSDCFDRISISHVGIFQAMAAVGLPDRDHGTSSSFPCRYTEALCSAALRNDKFEEHYFFRQIRKIQQRFPNKSGQILRMLYTYLTLESDSAETAVREGIHKNTVLYRISVLQELLEIDFGDMEATDALLMELQLYRLAQEKQQ